MFKSQIVTSDKTIVIEGPVKWHEVTVEQYQRIMKGWTDREDPILLQSLLYNIDYDSLFNCKNEVLIAALTTACRFIYTEPDMLQYRKARKSILIKGKEVTVPMKAGSRSYGQAVQLRRRMEKAKSKDELISIAAAIYLQPEYDGAQFSMDRALELEKEILTMPIYTIYPISFFFLSRLNNYGTMLEGVWNLLRLRNKKLAIKLLYWQKLNALRHLQI